jgi:hypothetical protein
MSPYDPYNSWGNPFNGAMNPLSNPWHPFWGHRRFHLHRPRFHSRYFPRFPFGPRHFPHPRGLPRVSTIRPHWPYRWRPYLPRLPRYKVHFPRYGRPYLRPTFSIHRPHWPRFHRYHPRHYNRFHPYRHLPRYQRHQLRRIFGPNWRYHVNPRYSHLHCRHHRPYWYRRWRHHMRMHRLKRSMRHHYRRKLHRMQRRMMRRMNPMGAPSMMQRPFYNNNFNRYYGRRGGARTIWLPEFYNGRRWIPHHPYLRPHPSVFYGPVHHHHHLMRRGMPFQSDYMMMGGGPGYRRSQSFVY